MKILLTGVSGLLGINFAITAAKNHDVLGVYHCQAIHVGLFKTIYLDLFNNKDVSQLLESWKPDCIVHCAALADVDQCEEKPQLADRINVSLTEKLSKIAEFYRIKFIFISTDAVFDGKKNCYAETDSPMPVNVYGATKVKAENSVLKNCSNPLIARVNFYGWSVMGTRSLAEWVINNLRKHVPIKGFVDICFTPLLANSLSNILLKMITAELVGIYHVVSSQKLTKYEFAVRLAKQFELDENLIIQSSVHDAESKAKRPLNIVLNNGKLISTLGNIVPDLYSDIRLFHQMEKSGSANQIRSMRAVSEENI